MKQFFETQQIMLPDVFDRPTPAADGSSAHVQTLSEMLQDVMDDRALAGGGSETQADYVGGTGDDVYTGTSDADTISGNGGNDTLAGAGGADTIDGGDGNDILSSAGAPGPWSHSYYYYGSVFPTLDRGTEVDTIRGGAGNDTIFAGYGDNVDGGADGASLLISFMGASSGVTVNFDYLYNDHSGTSPYTGTITIGGGTITNITGVQMVEGSDFADVITGGSVGYVSADIRGMGGNDTLIAGYYTSNLYGGDGDDILDGRGSSYSGTYFGEAGNDTIYTYASPNAVAYGGDGDDTFIGAGYLYGGAGNDTFTLGFSYYGASAYGEDGNDTFTGSDEANRLSGGAGMDVIHAGGGADQIYSAGNADSAQDQLDRGTEYDQLFGEGGDDYLYGGYGDLIDGGSGSNTLVLTLTGAPAGLTVDGNAIIAGGVSFGGGAISNIQAIARIDGTTFGDTIILPTQTIAAEAHGDAGNDIITAGGSAVTLYGDAGNDTLTGSSTYDTIYGGAGADTMSGGGGNDTFYVTAADVAAGESIDGGTGSDMVNVQDSVAVNLSLVTLSNIEQIFANDVIVGGAQLAGLTSLRFANLTLADGVAVSLAGTTVIGSTVNLSAVGNTFDMTGATMLSTYYPFTVNGGAGDDVVTTLESIDTIYGGGGNDTISSGAGDDTLYGGTGRDTFHAGDGNDTIYLSGTDFVAGEVYDGGNGSDRLILGGNLDLTSATLLSIETLGFAYNGSVTLTGAQLQGLSFLTTPGYSGYVSEVVNLTTGGAISFSGSGDVMTFNLAAVDTVFDLSGVVNALAEKVNGASGNDTITGSRYDDVLNGGEGNNTLIGGMGNDTLTAGSGSDRLDGGTGIDGMTGGAGNDTYVVDNTGDRVFESANGGTDTIETTLNNFVLGTTAGSANVENITLTGSANINATGNAGANVMVGNSGNNILTGGAGNDTLVGYGGADTLNGGADNDRLIVSTGGDGTVIDGGTGTDTLIVTGAVTLGGLAGIEAIDLQSGGALMLSGAQFNTGLAPNATLGGTGALTINMGAGDSVLYLQQLLGGSGVTITVNGSADSELIKGAVNAVNIINGGDGADAIRGSTQADTLNGGDGNDKIEGGIGADILTGGAGADTFRYQSASASTVAAPDRITDFVSGTDKLGFLLLDSDPNTPGIQGFSYIDTQAFHHTGAAEIRYETSGADLTVQVDVNGDGVADMAIILQGLGGTALTGGDFLI